MPKPKGKGASQTKKRCVKPTSYPCGFTCIARKNPSGTDRICHNILKNQAKTFTLWLALQEERLAKVNKYRTEKGRATYSLNDSKLGLVKNKLSETAKAEKAIAPQKGKQPPAEIVEKMNRLLEPLQEFNRLVESARQTGKIGGGASDRYIWDLGDKLFAQMNQFERNRKAWEEAYSLGVKNGFDMSAFNLPTTVALTKSEAKALKERWDGLGATKEAASPVSSKPTATTREQLIAEENRLGKELDAILNKYPGRRTDEQKAEIKAKEKEYFAANRALRDFNGGKSVESPVIAEVKPAIDAKSATPAIAVPSKTETIGTILKVGAKQVDLPKPLSSYSNLNLSHDPSLGWQVTDKDGDVLRQPKTNGQVSSHRFKERGQAENFAKTVMAKVDRAIAKQQKATKSEQTKATQSQKEEKAIAALEDLAKIRVDDTPKTTGVSSPNAGEQLRYNELTKLRHKALLGMSKGRTPKDSRELYDRAQSELNDFEKRFPGIKHTITQNEREKAQWDKTESDGLKSLSDYQSKGKRESVATEGDRGSSSPVNGGDSPRLLGKNQVVSLDKKALSNVQKGDTLYYKKGRGYEHGTVDFVNTNFGTVTLKIDHGSGVSVKTVSTGKGEVFAQKPEPKASPDIAAIAEQNPNKGRGGIEWLADNLPEGSEKLAAQLIRNSFDKLSEKAKETIPKLSGKELVDFVVTVSERLGQGAGIGTTDASKIRNSDTVGGIASVAILPKAIEQDSDRASVAPEPVKEKRTHPLDMGRADKLEELREHYESTKPIPQFRKGLSGKYAAVSSDGSTYGKQYETEADGINAYKEYRKKNAEDSVEAMRYKPEKDIDSQIEYWRKQRGIETNPVVPPSDSTYQPTAKEFGDRLTLTNDDFKGNTLYLGVEPNNDRNVSFRDQQSIRASHGLVDYGNEYRLVKSGDRAKIEYRPFAYKKDGDPISDRVYSQERWQGYAGDYRLSDTYLSTAIADKGITTKQHPLVVNANADKVKRQAEQAQREKEARIESGKQQEKETAWAAIKKEMSDALPKPKKNQSVSWKQKDETITGTADLYGENYAILKSSNSKKFSVADRKSGNLAYASGLTAAEAKELLGILWKERGDTPIVIKDGKADIPEDIARIASNYSLGRMKSIPDRYAKEVEDRVSSVNSQKAQAMQSNLFGGLDEIPVDKKREDAIAAQSSVESTKKLDAVDKFRPYIKPKKDNVSDKEFEQRIKESDDYFLSIARGGKPGRPTWLDKQAASVDTGSSVAGVGLTPTTKGFVAEQLFKLSAFDFPSAKDYEGDPPKVTVRTPGGGQYQIYKTKEAISTFLDAIGLSPKKGETLFDALKRNSEIVQNFSEPTLSPCDRHLLLLATTAANRIMSYPESLRQGIVNRLRGQLA